MKFNFANKIKGSDILVVGIFNDKSIWYCDAQDALIQELASIVDRINFDGKFAHIENLLTFQKFNYAKIVLVGLGAKGKLSLLDLQKIGKALEKTLTSDSYKSTEILVGELEDKKNIKEGIAANIAFGLLKASWQFIKYKTDKKKYQNSLEKITLITNSVDNEEKKFAGLQAIAEGIALCKDFVSEPSNELYPEVYAERIQQELSPLGIEVQIIGEKEMTKLGMNCFLAVGRGSTYESKMVVLQWHGGIDNQQPIAFIGKGVTFDSGGISIKPSNSMSLMKYDMSGSALVVGLMKSLALSKSKVNAIGIVSLAENMPSANAFKPGDVLTSMSGKTVEITNTDAEGRLILCDTLWYTQNRFKPQFMINAATLTGAIVITFGDEYAGLFSNNDELAQRLINSGNKSDNKVWRLPLGDNYQSCLDSYIADINHCPEKRGASSIMGGQFLQNFVNDVPWAHLDIAGVAWSNSLITVKDGATGFGVHLLVNLVNDYYDL